MPYSPTCPTLEITKQRVTRLTIEAPQHSVLNHYHSTLSTAPPLKSWCQMTMSVVYSSSHYSPGISVIFITNYFLYQRWKPICTFHKVAACQVLVSQASEDYNVRRKQDISRFWKRKANQFKIRWTKKPDASKLKNRYSESKLSTAARLKFYNSP